MNLICYFSDILVVLEHMYGYAFLFSLPFGARSNESYGSLYVFTYTFFPDIPFLVEHVYWYAFLSSLLFGSHLVYCIIQHQTKSQAIKVRGRLFRWPRRWICWLFKLINKSRNTRNRHITVKHIIMNTLNVNHYE